jgi:hypothetical protein
VSAIAPIVIEAVVDAAERPALAAARVQLAECLQAASGHAWPIELHFRTSIAALGGAGRPTLAIVSLLPELARNDEPIAQTAARWKTLLGLLAGVVPTVLVCTIFRHVGHDGPGGERTKNAPLLERIRKLDLFAAELSHDTGVGVIDIDRVCAHIGARALQSDYRLAGRIAAEVAAHTIVAGMLATALADTLPAVVLERAQQYQGDLSSIFAYVDRRLRQPAPALADANT